MRIGFTGSRVDVLIASIPAARFKSMTDRKPRPLWPLLTAALIGLPVLYVLSVGPWLTIRKELGKPHPAIAAVEELFFIAPRWLVYDSPDWLGKPYIRYLKLWDPDSDWLLFVESIRENPLR